MRRRGAALAALLLLAAAPPPEPPGLWSGPEHGAVPATLAGAAVLADAGAAARFLAAHGALPVDVAAAPVRPAGMAPDMPWLPPAHRDIPGSLWLPGAGQAVLDPTRARAFLAAVAARAGGDPGRFVLVYCHPACWSSWNAAKRLVEAGWRHVAWFPGGLEAWTDAELPLAPADPAPY